eukprot:g20611.t1
MPRKFVISDERIGHVPACSWNHCSTAGKMARTMSTVVWKKTATMGTILRLLLYKYCKAKPFEATMCATLQKKQLWKEIDAKKYMMAHPTFQKHMVKQSRHVQEYVLYLANNTKGKDLTAGDVVQIVENWE